MSSPSNIIRPSTAGNKPIPLDIGNDIVLVKHGDIKLNHLGIATSLEITISSIDKDLINDQWDHILKCSLNSILVSTKFREDSDCIASALTEYAFTVVGHPIRLTKGSDLVFGREVDCLVIKYPIYFIIRVKNLPKKEIYIEVNENLSLYDKDKRILCTVKAEGMLTVCKLTMKEAMELYKINDDVVIPKTIMNEPSGGTSIK
ncbi:matrix protein [Yerba mate virus A]|uniref:Matrix protein n=1 Tax=Yerba mate virus A TaxID=2713499 RepID=A0A6G6CIG6_9RHAB|nr:matrix protein [Yerba mate virus A]QID92309.1 matrix protein [Yerba mate virus A]